MALTLGVDFNCNASICYGIGAKNHALFQQLQQVLNQYGAGLAVDGFIGDATVNAVKRIASQYGTSRNAVAANAETIIGTLARGAAIAPSDPPPDIESAVQQAIATCRTDKSSPTCVNAKALCKTVRGTSNAKLPGIDELCTVRMPAWAKWTLKATAIVGASVLVGGFMYRRYHRTR